MQCRFRARQHRPARGGEDGSALLIVLVFSAIVAIMLYRALPDVYFEAQRQKEQLLIDRGNQYKIALKRFYGKNKTFPTSLSQLDNFNNVRYLRHHYKDPMTGKEEWRLIHVMGPGFILTDSKVTPMNAQNKAQSQNGGFSGMNSGNSFGQNSTTGAGASHDSSSAGSASGSDLGSPSSPQDQADANGQPAPTAAQLYGALRRPPARPIQGAIPEGFEEPQPGPQEGQEANAEQPEMQNGQPSPVAEGAVPGAQPMQPGAQPAMQPGVQNAGPNGQLPPNADPNNPASTGLRAVNATLRQQQTVPTQSSSSGFGKSTFGNIPSGAIAGVASTAKGSSIKVIEKQTDYSKWEFVYNPDQDRARKMQGALNGVGNGQNANGNSTFGGAGRTGGFGQTGQSSFGSDGSFGNSSSSSFGSSSANSSSFGSNSNSQQPTNPSPNQ